MPCFLLFSIASPSFSLLDSLDEISDFNFCSEENQALSLSGFEPLTLRLSGVHSNQPEL
jgi:hypothetical protein